jgi:DNA polymerase-1
LELVEKEMDKLLYDIEIPLARVLARWRRRDSRLTREGLIRYGIELDLDIEELTKRIYFQAGVEFNINSPKQLASVLFDQLGLPAQKKTKSGYSTDADTLDYLRRGNPIVEDILSYRKLAKLKSTYVEGLASKIGDDGRVRSLFRQTETRTGRISSTEPNLQNIPIRTERGSRLRRFFVASPGCRLVDADYSQIELRVLAHIADDAAMIESFVNNEDIHTRTARRSSTCPRNFVTAQMRSRAKAVNFGIVYGSGPTPCPRTSGVTGCRGRQVYKNYLSTYSGVKKIYGSGGGICKRKRICQDHVQPPPPPSGACRIQQGHPGSWGEDSYETPPYRYRGGYNQARDGERSTNRLRSEKMEVEAYIIRCTDELIVEAPSAKPRRRRK